MSQKVSVVTPAYNRIHFLKELIRYMHRQTHTDWELVVVDDGSTDNIREVLKTEQEKDARIVFHQRKELPKGATKCRNIGVKQASGDFIIFLDSDDLLASFALEQRVSYMQKYPEIDFAVFYGLKFFNEPGDSKAIVNKETSTQNSLKNFLSRNYPWHTSAPIWRKHSLIKHQLCWDEKLSIFQDVDFHIRALVKDLKFSINKQAQPDYFWRQHADQDKLSSYKGFPARFDSCEHFLLKLGEIIGTCDMLDKDRKNILAANFFSVARILTMENELSLGLKLWQTGYFKNYINPGRYFLGKLFLHSFNLIYRLFPNSNLKLKHVFRSLYYKVIPSSFDKDKDVLLFREEIKT